MEADLIGYDGIPPLHETLAELQACGETLYGYCAAENQDGVVACEVAGEALTSSRMMVGGAFCQSPRASRSFAGDEPKG